MLDATPEIVFAAPASATTTAFTVPPEIELTPLATLVGIVVAPFCTVSCAEPVSTAESPEVIAPVPVIEAETAATFACDFASPSVSPPTIAIG